MTDTQARPQDDLSPEVLTLARLLAVNPKSAKALRDSIEKRQGTARRDPRPALRGKLPALRCARHPLPHAAYRRVPAVGARTAASPPCATPPKRPCTTRSPHSAHLKTRSRRPSPT